MQPPIIIGRALHQYSSYFTSQKRSAQVIATLGLEPSLSATHSGSPQNVYRGSFANLLRAMQKGILQDITCDLCLPSHCIQPICFLLLSSSSGMNMELRISVGSCLSRFKCLAVPRAYPAEALCNVYPAVLSTSAPSNSSQSLSTYPPPSSQFPWG